MIPKILIADSSSVMRTTIKNSLAESGFTDVTEAQDGGEACIVFDNEKPDIVILDLSLPGKTGMETMRDMIKKNPKTKIIVCSASSYKELVIESVALGAVDFIRKPLNTERLIKTINKIIS